MESSSLTAEDRLRVDSLRALVRKNLSEYYDTDFNLLRWLQGHPGSVEEVAEKLNDHLKARCSSWKLDDFLSVPRRHPIHNHWKHGITGLSGVLENVIVNIEQVAVRVKERTAVSTQVISEIDDKILLGMKKSLAGVKGDNTMMDMEDVKTLLDIKVEEVMLDIKEDKTRLIWKMEVPA
ncbi:unnamed protein product [Toxocara canis]|uniref:Rx_N domain-containing protein n=1 Tax=Toxocara canis TaxID=6265 RepID=A0A183UA94_TOXCA|nr:unnamed protein product [Toxocara canis]